MKLEIDIPEHHYNNIMALDSVILGRVPYKGIFMHAINAIKHGKVLEQEPKIFEWCDTCKEYDQENHCCHRWAKVIRNTVEEMKQGYERKVLEKIRDQLKSNLRGVEITLEVLVENDPLRPKMEGAKDTLEDCLELIDKAESEDKE